VLTRSTLIGALALSISAVAGSAGALGAEPVTINLISLPSDTAGEVYYAQELGYFKDAGLDVHITDMTSSPAIISAVASGAADVGFSVVGTAALARQRGIPVRFVAAGALYIASNPTAQLIGAKDTTIRTAADLSGKTVAVTGIADLTYYGTRAWIDKNGGDAASVKFIELSFPEMTAAVVQHRVDAAMIAQPFLAAALPQTKAIAPVDDAVASRFMSTGWIASETWLNAHRDAAVKFAAVMRQTAQWANAHHKESAQILMHHTKITPEIAATMTRVEYGLSLDPKLLQPPIDVAARYSQQHFGPATDLIWPPAGR
jgi:NitT/TauT family transport system substrate-binding protein